MAKEYVLVSQGVEIYRTRDKEKATRIMDEENQNYIKAVESARDGYEMPPDTRVEMFEEDVKE